MKKLLCLCSAFVMMLFVCGCFSDTKTNIGNNSNATAQTQENTDNTEDASVTTGQRNALKKAKSYLKTMAFSREGLIEQLEFEGYTTDEATYGADNCGADWNEQAAKKAESYLDIMAFSREGLIEQLEFEGFTNEQAVYGVTANGY